MKRWVLIGVIVVLVLLGFAVPLWLPAVLDFVGANSDLIQGIEAAVQLLLWVGAAAIAGIGYLRGRQARGQAQQVDTGGGAVIGGSVTQTGGEFSGRDRVTTAKEGSVSIGGGVSDALIINADVVQVAGKYARMLASKASPANLSQTIVDYLRYVLDRHRYLSLKGMGVADRIPLRLPLLDLYVPLKARLELPEGETWGRGIRLAGRAVMTEDEAGWVGRLGEPQPVLDLIQKHDGLIILGDPGAGKTTFLKYLALRLALGEGQAVGLADRLPILAPLSAYANALDGNDVRLDDFISDYFHDIGADWPIGPLLAEALQKGKALVLLDGLDEVKDLGLRHTVVERVTDFYTLHRQPGNKFVLTSRIVGYREVRPTAEGLVECTLVDFDADEIEAFVERWTTTVERQAQGDGAVAQVDAAQERHDLLDAIERNPGVRHLAANPLLLTILALMKRQGVTLPERRVQLYEQYVRTLLSTWNRARGLGRPPTRDLDEVQTLRVLAPLALWMHEVNPGVGLVKREDVRRQLASIYAGRGEADPDAAARQFLEDVREYAGLLLERGPGEYGFIHLTFEEYLAAVAIALQAQGDCRPIVDILAAHVAEPAWQEVAQLAVGYVGISQQLDRVAGEVVTTLVDEQPGPPGAAAVLAGAAVLDAWPPGIPPASKERVVDALVAAMQDGQVEFSLRRQAGLLLGRLGWLPQDLETFVEVPPGPFLYGNDKTARQISQRYWIARYPVTNTQYARFMANNGYARPEFWSTAGWAWRQGAKADLSYIKDAKLEEFYTNWLAQRPATARRQPYWWDDLERANPLLPVVGISVYEAEAYAAWLDTQLDHIPLPDGQSAARPSSYTVRLATEEEWERAARGSDGREYPWGDEFQPEAANVAEEIGRGVGATAVATYPQGISPAGAWDLSGNVWEWTLSEWAPGQEWRVVRGGSWNDFRRDARAAYRIRYVPGHFGYNVGLRVVVSLSSGF